MADVKQLVSAAFSCMSKGDLDEAIAKCHEAIAQDENQAMAYGVMAKCYQRKKMLDQAIEAQLKVVELEPNEPLSFTGLSQLYNAKGMIPEAEMAMARAHVLERG